MFSAGPCSITRALAAPAFFEFPVPTGISASLASVAKKSTGLVLLLLLLLAVATSVGGPLGTYFVPPSDMLEGFE